MPALGFTLGTILNIVLRRKYSAEIGRVLIPVAICCILVVALVLHHVSGVPGYHDPKAIIELVTFTFFCVGVAQPLLTNLAISCHSELAGTALVWCVVYNVLWRQLPACLLKTIIAAAWPA